MSDTEPEEKVPPWAKFPQIHPYSIHWRMGAGESYLMEYWDWWRTAFSPKGTNERIDYVRKYPFAPVWTEHVLEMIWDISFWEMSEDEAESARQKYFELGVKHGFPSRAEMEMDHNDPKWRQI